MPSLRLVPYGAAAIDTLRRELAAAKGDDPLRPVTVAVPSNYAGLSLRRLLASEGNGLVNVRFVVLPRVAELLGAPALADEGRTPLTSTIRAEAVRAVLADEAGIFSAFRDHAATERSLESTFHDLRRAPEEALAVLEQQSERAAEVVKLYRRFRDKASLYYDEEDLALSAAAAVRAGSRALRDIGHVIVYLPRRLSPAEQSLLEALAETHLLTVIIGLTNDAAADAAPRLLAGQLELFLGNAEETAVEPSAPLSRLIVVTDAEEEVRAVIRDVMEQMGEARPLHRVAILYRATQPYALLVQEQLRAGGIPFNGPGVQTLAQTTAGRTLLGLLRLKENDLRRDLLMDWLSNAPVVDANGEEAPAQHWDRLSRSAGIVRGASQWRERLAAYRRRLESERADLESQQEASEGRLRGLDSEIEETERLARFMADIEQSLQTRGIDSWPGFAAWGRDLLGRYLGGEARQGRWLRDGAEQEEEIERYRKMMSVLREMEALSGLREKIDEHAFRRALERELEATAGKSGRFGEGVFVGPLTAAAGVDFGRVYVLGMVEGLMPSRTRDDPLVPDRERSAAGEEMPLRSARRDDERREYLAALASAPERVLLYPRADLRGQRGKLPAPWWLEEASRLEGNALYSSDVEGLPSRDWLTRVPSFYGALARGGEPASEQEYDLRSLLHWRDAGRRIDDHHLLRSLPVLHEGIACERARRGRELTRWDGGLNDMLPDPPSPDHPVSPTSLQNWATCPFRYFLGSALRIAEMEKPEDTLNIEPRERGTLLHRALEEFIRDAPPPSPETPWGEEERERLRRLGERLCDEAEASGLTGKRLFWKLARRDIMRDLAGFLDADERMRRSLDVIPLAVEVAFGLAGAEPATVKLGDGRGIAFRGKIDRVDRSADGSRAVVLDYKSGTKYGYKDLDRDPVRQGQLLQLPIYALAAKQKWDVSVVQAHYWFVSEVQGYERKGYEVDESRLSAFLEALGVIVDGISEGLFPARPGQQREGGFENCRFCPYDRVCLRERGRSWERKRGTPALQRYVKLAEPRRETNDDE